MLHKIKDIKICVSFCAQYSFGELGSPCLTPLFIGNSSDTRLSKIFTYFSFMLAFFPEGSKDGKAFYCVKGFLVINEAYG